MAAVTTRARSELEPITNFYTKISGTENGIDLGLAEVCLANGAGSVFSLDTSHRSDDFTALSKRYPEKLAYIHTDVIPASPCKSALDTIVSQKSCFDSMNANAGVTKRALDFILEPFEKVYKLDVTGSWICATASAAPSAPYRGTKAAGRNMTHTPAPEWSHFVRTADILCEDEPGDRGAKMKYYGGTPRLALLQELGGASLCLLSDCATYTTGTDIPIVSCGGLSLATARV
ncbi:uncharacterized protein BCR38DRAFT_508966 [Pseudomassariella vexata]|uniref:NAD(P)-binding protein n=1 Tax=Pseudomassariella vexata TaxID=1141098 RepID=A0A1Y2D6Z8_9PEZI|nr:uncharacterized protein BCR38DRAFT_508966 [Pseudomassariella vexata]ORY54846.1 hypothetical protein BCR38DRAFT_508966 [Pseudomassariella vexata]